jgi:hypothetical protein
MCKACLVFGMLGNLVFPGPGPKLGLGESFTEVQCIVNKIHALVFSQSKKTATPQYPVTKSSSLLGIRICGDNLAPLSIK